MGRENDLYWFWTDFALCESSQKSYELAKKVGMEATLGFLDSNHIHWWSLILEDKECQ